AMRDLIDATKGEHGKKYVDECEDLLKLRREQHSDELLGRDASPEFSDRRLKISKLQTDIASKQEGAEDMVESTMADIKDQKGRDAKEEELFAKYRRAYATMTGPIRRLRDANKKLTEKLNSDLAELRPLLQDKFVFVGYTATAQGDIVSTPIYPALPGVI